MGLKEGEAVGATVGWEVGTGVVGKAVGARVGIVGADVGCGVSGVGRDHCIAGEGEAAGSSDGAGATASSGPPPRSKSIEHPSSCVLVRVHLLV